MKKEIQSLYVLKALGAFCVILLHFNLYKHQYLEPIYRLGVPIFYTIGGFFLYSSDVSMVKQRCVKSIKKLTKLIIFFNAVYAIFYYFTGLLTFHLNIGSIVRLFFVGDNIAGHLWFLNGYLWSAVIILLVCSLRLWKLLPYIAATLLVLNFVCGQYSYVGHVFLPSFIFDNLYLTLLWISFPFIAVGMFIRKYETWIVNNINHVGQMLVVAILLCYVEHLLWSYRGGYTACFKFSTFMALLSCMAYCVKKEQIDIGGGKMLALIGKCHSGNIYYWQFFVYYAFIEQLVNIYPELNNVMAFIMYVVLILLSSMVTYIFKSLPLSFDKRCNR